MPVQDIQISELGEFLEGIVGVTEKPEADKAMQEILEVTKADLNEGFETGTAPDGTKWLPLARPRKPPHNLENKPLLNSFKLQKSVVEQGPEHLEAVSGEGLKLGTYVFYAMFHQNGTSKIPQREFMAFSEKVQVEAADITADALIEQIDNL